MVGRRRPNLERLPLGDVVLRVQQLLVVCKHLREDGKATVDVQIVGVTALSFHPPDESP